MPWVRKAAAAPRGTTLVELTVATALMATVFAAILPLFAGIRNSAEARWAGLEMLQNARVLNEHLCRHLAQARRIVAVSGSLDDAGYLEFEAHDGVVYRCAVGPRGCVEFGPASRPHELAGPVRYLRFVCYRDADPDRPLRTPEDTRFVRWEARFESRGQLMQDKTVTGACCLRGHAGKVDSGESVGNSQ